MGKSRVVTSEGMKIEAVDPRTGVLWPLFVSAATMKHTRSISVGADRELAFTVPDVLQSPTAVYRGLRDRRDEGDVSLCYAGLPKKGYDWETGQQFEAVPGEIFLVFVNRDRQVFLWRWERADDENPRLPRDHESRFIERWL